MIDETLARLSRDLIAASDKLDSEDFKQRQARFIALEAERAQLAESLEADEAAVVAAQTALQHHVHGSMLDADEGTYGISEDELLEAVQDRYGFQQGLNAYAPSINIKSACDEFSDARAPYTNGTGD